MGQDGGEARYGSALKVITDIEEMRSFSRDAREGSRGEGRSIALVPTMGALHKGHLELIKEARRLADIVVLTVFVNPTQFSPTEDLESYPRDIDSDLEKARAAGVDVVFTPTALAMYPEGFQTRVQVSSLEKYLCGLSRSGHFTGVATVVLKLFNITAPHWAVFGEKDYQQLLIIRRMAEDLDLGIKITGVPTVRDPDGLAMSSRNRYLTGEQRQAAICLPRSLLKAREVCGEGMEAEAVIATVEAVLKSEGLVRVEYVKVVDAGTLEDLLVLRGKGSGKILIQAVVRIGRARLIDHILI